MIVFRKIRTFGYNFVHPVRAEIWLLHSITNEFSKDFGLHQCEVTPSYLEKIITDALSSGFEFISVDGFYDIYVSNQGEISRKKHYIVVTLDDGYRNVYDVAYPIFKKYDIPFCLFISPALLTGEAKVSETEPKEMMTIEQLQLISKSSLCTVGSHAISHQALSKMPIELQKQELEKSKADLEKMVGNPVRFLAYPLGDYDAETITVAKSVGYDMAFAAWGGCMRSGVGYDKYAVPRKIIFDK